ncbi:MAG: response regulator [Chloroflexi bacterium]|nr:response regulator [Chloroflexota bacterium]
MTGMGNAFQGAPPRVLVVEDDQSVRRMLRFSLRTTGYSVTEVTTGMEAIRELERQPTDAVVLDLGLPDGLGGKVLCRLRQLAGEPRGLPIWVVISALDRDEAAARYGPLGSHFMAKPFDPWDLMRTLEVLLGAKREEGHA